MSKASFLSCKRMMFFGFCLRERKYFISDRLHFPFSLMNPLRWCTVPIKLIKHRSLLIN